VDGAKGEPMKTLRGQLTAWFIGLITVIGIVAGIGTGLVSFREESGFLDDQLRQIALNVGDNPSAAGESSQIIAGADPDDHIIVHVLDNNLRTIRNSDPSIGIPVETVTGFYDHVDQGKQWRTFTLIAENRVVQISQQTEIRTAAAFASMLNTVLPIIFLIPLSWILVGWVVRRLLRPMQDLTMALRARQAVSNEALDSNGLPGEVVPLVDAMNGLLVRQQELLEFRQRFISDAAHQLRTPLTALHLQLENLKQAIHGRKGSMLLEPLTHGLSRMAGLLEQLLKLARAEEPHGQTQDSLVSLSEVVRESMAGVYELAVAKCVDVGVTADAGVIVRGAAHDLTMLFGNLLDNAVRYTPGGGKVDVEILANGDDASVIIRDSGPGIPECAMALVFDRFYRHNPQSADGSGLGLAIVAALAARNGADVKLQNCGNGAGLLAKVEFAGGLLCAHNAA
jgi:two-component system, OmpR family, sensor kinase